MEEVAVVVVADERWLRKLLFYSRSVICAAAFLSLLFIYLFSSYFSSFFFN